MQKTSNDPFQIPAPQQTQPMDSGIPTMPQPALMPAPVTYSSKSMAEGGLMQEGGSVDEVSGNKVPTGSLKEEVRDDIPAKLSEGEFVFPADVVRFIGLERLMQMRQAAKEGLAKMEAMGQMGNSEEATEDDEGEFETEIDDIINEVEQEEAYEMYVGGYIKKKYAAGGVVDNSKSVDQQMESGAMTSPTSMSSKDIIRNEIKNNPDKQTTAEDALQSVASNNAVMVRENNSIFVLSTITPGIMRMNTFTADDPKMLSDSINKAVPVLRASRVNGIEVVDDNPNIKSAFEQSGYRVLPKGEGSFVVDLTKRV